MEHFAVGGNRLLSGFPNHFSGLPKLEAISRVISSTAVGELMEANNALALSSSSWKDETTRHVGTGLPDQKALLDFFDHTQVEQWDPERFLLVRKLQNATRNHGQVVLMNDTLSGTLYAVKQMPNEWVAGSAREFSNEHPLETEHPWADISCIKYLNSIDFQYACDLIGVYRDDKSTYVVQTFAPIGDLFSWCEVGPPPGPAWELAVFPVAQQIAKAVLQLHDIGLVHRDLSLENVILDNRNSDTLHARVIDFGMVSTSRHYKKCIRGKASYQAPEMHGEDVYDGYLSDAFALGVTLYTLVVKDYPWLSTRRGGCKCCDYVQKNGFRPYLEKRKLRSSNIKVSAAISEPFKELLEGLLAFSPKDRLTLGERDWSDSRRSVWDTAWMRHGPSGVPA